MLKISTLSDITNFISHKPEIKVLERDNMFIVDYEYVTSTTFDSPQALECRGIKFDSRKDIIARPFHKFFNLGEPGCPVNRSDSSQRFSLLEKDDGSMVHTCIPMYSPLCLMTRRGLTDQAFAATELLYRKYPKFVKQFENSFYHTHMFEYVGPSNPHIEHYQEDKLIYLGSREMYWGDYYTFFTSPAAFEKRFEFSVSKKYFTNLATLKDVEDCIKPMQVGEGFVLYEGAMPVAKIKTDLYLSKHRVKDSLSNREALVQLILEDGLDDLLPLLDLEKQKQLSSFRDSVVKQFYDRLQSVETVVRDFVDKGGPRREFALNIVDTYPQWVRAAYFGALDQKDYVNILKNCFIKYNEHLGDIE